MTETGITSVPIFGAITAERKEYNKFDVEICPDANQPYDIYDRVGFVPTSYTINNQNTRIDNCNSNLNGTLDTSPKVNWYPDHHLTLAGTPYTSPR